MIAPSLSLFVSCLSGVAVFSLVLGFARLLRKPGHSVTDRLRELERQRQSLDLAAMGVPSSNGRVAMTIDRLTENTTFAQRLTDDLRHAGVSLTPGEFLVSVGLAVVLGVLVALWLGNIVLGLLLVVAAGVVPRQWLRQRMRRRVRQFNQRLPTTLGLLANSVRSGSSLPQAIELAAREEPMPVSTELRRVVGELSVGIALPEALAHMIEDMPSEELQLVVTALLVQYESGGNIVQILDRIGEVLRERIKLNGDIQALTAQQRYSGYIVALMPIGLSGLLLVINPSYILNVFRETHWCGFVMFGTAAVLILVGITTIQRLVNIKV
jgi:tight adherence protein B